MYFTNKYINYELRNNKTFIKVTIDKNVVICENDIIKKDINNKLNFSINHIEFYVSLFDYNVIKPTYYWDTIKNIPNKYLPIYKKNTDFKTFIDWLISNNKKNKVRYETSKFTKRKFVFKNNQECLNTVKWEQTNPKHKHYNQLLYHASDVQDIERYGFLYIRTIFNNPININPTTNVWYNTNLNIWPKFKTDFQTIKNTMTYMFDKMKKGVLVGIKNNKLVIFLPFSKYNYKNDFYTELYFDENDKRLLQKYNKTKDNKILKQLENNVKYFFSKYKLKTDNIFLDRQKWVANDCFFRYENYEGDKLVVLYEHFMRKLCKNRQLPDSIFFLNLRDHPVLNKNLKDSYTSIIDRDLDKKYKFNNYAPIFSVGPSKETADIPLVTPDDWLRASKFIYPDDCKNGYINKVKIIDWKDKKNVAVFRGSATGCQIGENNPRIKAAMLSKQYPTFLNAGIVSFNRKLKKNINEPLKIINTSIGLSNFMTLEEKATYKYILNLDGHVSAFRLGHEFSLRSVLLIPQSKYYLWFSYLLKPYEHYVPINENLDDLIDKIKWCIDNDNKCKTIADNGYSFYKKYLKREAIYDYMQNALYKIQFNNLNFKKYSMNIGIITIFRDDAINSRLEQKRQFLYNINKMFNQLCDYNIIVVEQSKDNLFNIGKLKNIGYHYLKKNKKKFDNYIFTDIDIIPDSDLIDYYFKITDSLNSLGIRGSRYVYESRNVITPGAGSVVACTDTVFEELNGYPNNFYGWQGEDTDLLLRLHELNKPLYYPTVGRVIDIEEISGKTKDVSTKLEELKGYRENLAYQKNANYKKYKQNGLSNLNYEILDELNYENYFHIFVNLLYDESVKKYPHDYIFNEISGEEYDIIKKKVRNVVNSIKMVKI